MADKVLFVWNVTQGLKLIAELLYLVFAQQGFSCGKGYLDSVGQNRFGSQQQAYVAWLPSGVQASGRHPVFNRRYARGYFVHHVNWGAGQPPRSTHVFIILLYNMLST